MSESTASPYVEWFARAGDTFKRRLLLRADDKTTPIDLTSCSVEFSIAATPGGAPSYQYVDDANASITNAANGQIDLVLTPALTRALAPRVWGFEVTVTFSDSTRTTIAAGPLSVEAEQVV